MFNSRVAKASVDNLEINSSEGLRWRVFVFKFCMKYAGLYYYRSNYRSSIDIVTAGIHIFVYIKIAIFKYQGKCASNIQSSFGKISLASFITNTGQGLII